MAELLVSDPSQIPEQVVVAIGVLAPIFEQTRYPSEDVTEPIPADLITEEIAQSAIEATDEVMRSVRQLLGRP